MKKAIFGSGIYIYRFEEIESVLNRDSKDTCYCIRMLYRAETGQLGFDADTNALSLMRWILSDAWVWDSKAKKRKIFAEIKDKLDDPVFYFSNMTERGRASHIITYHKPGERIISLFEEAEDYHLSGKVNGISDNLPLIDRLTTILDFEEVIIKYLTDIADFCETVILWLMGQRETILIMKDYLSFKQRLLEKYKKSKINVCFVEKQNQLPEW